MKVWKKIFRFKIFLVETHEFSFDLKSNVVKLLNAAGVKQLSEIVKQKK